jgi:hypothetical protein
VLGCLALWSRKWVGVWVGPRGKVLSRQDRAAERAHLADHRARHRGVGRPAQGHELEQRGAILPNAMGLSKQYTGGFAAGFLFYAAFTAVVLARRCRRRAPRSRP